MIDISTLFESLFNKPASDYWEHLSYETIDQPLTTVIVLMAVALFQILRLAHRRLWTDKDIGLHQIGQHLPKNLVAQEPPQNPKQITSLSLDQIRNKCNESFQKSLEGKGTPKKQETTGTQLKQEKTECWSRAKCIEQFKRKRNEAKVKQAHDAKRVMLHQKMKKQTDQRNKLVYEQMKGRLSALFNSKKTKTALKPESHQAIEQSTLVQDGKVNLHQFTNKEQPLTVIGQFPKAFTIPPVAKNQQDQQSNQIQNKPASSALASCPKGQASPQNDIPVQKTERKQGKQQSPNSLKQIVCEEQFLQTIMNFACSVKSTAEITTAMSNLGGARSSLSNLLIFAKSFISTINLSKDNQVTAFGLKIYNSIVFTLIHNSNLREGVERMPPRSKSSQVEKNSINCYILILNVYRLMGLQKIWLIVFGKLLKLLQFTYKRRHRLQSYEQLELIINGYIEKKGEISSRYLSRLDYLTYLLLGLTAFDPILVWDLHRKDQQVFKGREEMLSWKTEWQYKEFWILVKSILKHENQFYFQPVIFMNMLAVLYPRIYMHKSNAELFKHEMVLYQTILHRSKDFFAKYKTNEEIQALSNNSRATAPYQYDGEDFKQGIKVLQNRILVQKTSQVGMNACEFEAKANVFYYFTKEK